MLGGLHNYDFEVKTYFSLNKAITHKSLVILPLENKRKLQKFAIGDGKMLQYWEYKKGEVVQSFKSEPFPLEISRIVLSGTGDKASIFLAAGQSIRGLTKRGKDFFKLDTSHTEVIQHLHVAGTNLWSAGPYTLVCYESRDNRIADKYFYTCEEQINELIVAQLPSS